MTAFDLLFKIIRMIFISKYQHGTFLRCLQDAVQQFEADNTRGDISELNADAAALENICREYQHAVDQLRKLAEQSRRVQKATRVRLRNLQVNHQKQLRVNNKKTI